MRLLSELAQRRKKVVNRLGLDETDTTPKELFYALRHRAVDTNRLLEAELSIDELTSPLELCEIILEFIESLNLSRDTWTIKPTIIKQLLKKQPPKKLLKVLGLRSIDSFLKRGNPCEILALAYQIETAEWCNKLHQQYKKLSPSEFQSGKSKVYMLEPSKLEKLYKSGYRRSNIIVPNYETGTVILIAPQERFPLDTLAVTLAVLQTLYDIRVYSAYFRFISVKAAFGDKLHKSMREGLPGNLQDGEIGWKALQKHFNQNSKTFGHFEQPHFQYEDIKVVAPVEILAEALPATALWKDAYVAFLHDNPRPVSLHLPDVVVNASNQLTYENSIYPHLRNDLWDELGTRYLQSEPLMNMVIELLDSENYELGNKKL